MVPWESQQRLVEAACCLSNAQLAKNMLKNLWPPSGEVVRICSVKSDSTKIGSSNYSSTTKMLTSFALVLVRSKRLCEYAMSNPEKPLFTVNSAVEDIIEVKRINKSNKPKVFENMAYCLHAMRLISIVNIELHAMKKFVFDMENSNHRVLLEAFWSNMKNTARRYTIRLHIHYILYTLYTIH